MVADESTASLVTGATGFTGGALALALRRRGERVRALVRDPGRAGRLEQAGVELVSGDVLDAAAVDRATRGCSHVYHLAAVYRTAVPQPQLYHDVHVRGTEHVLAAARRWAVQRVVHCSTAGVHGHVSEVPADENAPYNPGDVYQRTKLAGERVAQEAIRQGQPVSIVRPAGIYGPGDLRFLKLFRTIANGTFRMFGSGETMYHLTYIDDLIDGFVLCAHHDAARGEIFLVCGDEYVTLNDLVSRIAATLGVKAPRRHLPVAPLLAAGWLCERACLPLGIAPPLYTRRCEFFIKSRAFTNGRIRQRLGYEPNWSLDAGLAATARWYVDQGHLAAPRRRLASGWRPAAAAGGEADDGRTQVRRVMGDGALSPLHKYMWLTIGRGSLLGLLRYELLTGIAQAWPGAAGYLLRRRLYRRLWGRCGRGVTIGRNVVIRQPQRIFIGDNVIIDDNVVLDAKGDGDQAIVIGDDSIIGRNTILSCKGGTIRLGRRVNISCNCTLISETRMVLEDRVLVAGHCYLIAGGNHGLDRVDVPIVENPMTQKGGVVVEQNSWLGAQATVLDGVRVGRDAVVAAGAVVTRGVEAYAVVAGVPARLVRRRGDDGAGVRAVAEQEDAAHG